jgi:hypothetical protein
MDAVLPICKLGTMGRSSKLFYGLKALETVIL